MTASAQTIATTCFARSSLLRTTGKLRAYWQQLVPLCLVLLIVGCGETKVPVFPVSGNVTFKGEIPKGATVVLHPQSAGSTLPSDVSATGKVGADGTFTIGVYGTNDGAPAGDYIVTVVWNKAVTNEGGTGPGPNVIPPKYSDPKSSPIKLTVSNGPTQIPPFDITD